jgi:very-short-patch-repair endonuclease
VGDPEQPHPRDVGDPERLYPAPDDSRLAELATSQHGVVSREQLFARRFTRHAIETRLARRRLHRIHRGVYAVGHTRLTVRARWMAAVLACGTDAALSHQDAAALHGLLKIGSGDIHVTALKGHSIDGICCHCVRAIRPADVSKIDGIRVTTLPRTLLDLAEATDRSDFAAALKQAQHEDTLDLRALTATMARNHGRRGVKALRDLTEEPGWTQSELERRFVALTRAHGLPRPLTNQYVEGELVDAYWPDHRLIVEVDGWRTHKTRAAFEADRVRDAKLVAAGYRVLRITYRRLRDDPRGVADDLRRALSV